MSGLRSPLLFVAFAFAASVLYAACGGSSSQTPWPTEPDTPVIGGKIDDGTGSEGAPDAGADAAPN